jgi:hypothetical protein
VAEAVGHREERLVLGRLAGGSQRGERATVEAAVGADDHVATAATELAGQLQRGLVRFGAAVAEEHLPLDWPVASAAVAFTSTPRPAPRSLANRLLTCSSVPGLMSERLGDRRVRVTRAT